MESHEMLMGCLAMEPDTTMQYLYGIHVTRLTPSLAGSFIGAEVFMINTNHLFNKWDLWEKLDIPLGGALRLPHTASEKFAFVQKVKLTRWLRSDNQYEVFIDFMSEPRAETLDLREGLLPVYIFMA